MARVRALVAGLVTLLVAGCGASASGPPARSFAAIETCLHDRGQTVTVVPLQTNLFGRLRPRPTALFSASGVLIARYSTVAAAAQLFARLRYSGFSLLEARGVIVATPTPPGQPDAGPAVGERCAFGTGVTPQRAPVARPNSVTGLPTPASGATSQAVTGETVIGQSGCLACHQLGRYGNNGPGPPLTTVGRRLTAAEIRQTLIHPTAPMPSFGSLPRRDFDALVAYLAALRG